MNKPQDITTLPESPDAERRRRMMRYTIAMAVRMVCILLCFIVQGWWLVLPVLGAVVLPYIAVVIANVSAHGGVGKIERPELFLTGPDGARSSDG